MLIIRFSALGDVAMTVPAIYSLATRYPDLNIDVVTRPFFARLFINAPDNVNVIGVDFNKDYKGVGGTLRLLRRLGKLRPDYVADLHNVLRSWIIDRYFRLRGVKVVMVDKMRGKTLGTVPDRTTAAFVHRPLRKGVCRTRLSCQPDVQEPVSEPLPGSAV